MDNNKKDEGREGKIDTRTGRRETIRSGNIFLKRSKGKERRRATDRQSKK